MPSENEVVARRLYRPPGPGEHVIDGHDLVNGLVAEVECPHPPDRWNPVGRWCCDNPA